MDVAVAARHVEALGLDSVWAADLIIGAGTPAPEASIALASAATDRGRHRFRRTQPAATTSPGWLHRCRRSSTSAETASCSGRAPADAPFWRAIGVARRDRGRRTDAALAVLARLIAGEPTQLMHQPGEQIVTPAPGAPVPPILIGGNSDTAIHRPASYGDGWLPSQIAPHTLAAGVAKLRQLTAERVAQYAAAGADCVIVSPGIGSVGAQWMRQCELVAQARAMLT
ncbi:LLM class flavin-dependent oxidoreductase [Kribbella sp. NPDC026611]|uniref:LLM class flavin-dependent oxidoreductase n=1 Tax=Kribbella sp. NPDC026611 TaxID=3154911 RepID=UPI00340C3E26